MMDSKLISLAQEEMNKIKKRSLIKSKLADKMYKELQIYDLSYSVCEYLADVTWKFLKKEGALK